MISPQHELAAAGFKVFPCVPNGKTPLTPNGHLAATDNAVQISEWTLKHKGCNWAIATACLLIVDVDKLDKHSDEPKENPWLTDERARLLSVAPMARTPSGGRHYCFKDESGQLRNTVNKIAQGVDTRATGGFLLVEPSVIDGKPYEWVEGAPEGGPAALPAVPQWLLATLAEPEAKPLSSDPGGKIREGERNDHLFRDGCAMRSRGMSYEAILAALNVENTTRCDPPLPGDQVETAAQSAAKYPPGDAPFQPIETPRNMTERLREHTGLRQPVIHGLLREGETMNVIAPPKTGKSWLVYGLALSIISGKRWLDTFLPVPGKVLLIDNELHDETLADRIPRVAEALKIGLEEYGEQFDVLTLRGKLKDIEALGQEFATYKRGQYSCIIVDALYRALPKGKQENVNEDLTAIYNLIDSYAMHMGAAIVLIHHTSKGNQSEKSVTDTGSGAGAISRATDSQVVLREHEQPGAVVMEAALRSWPAIAPLCLRWEFPLWKPDSSLDASALKRNRKPKAKAPEEEWTAKRFADEFITYEPAAKSAIIDDACAAGLTAKAAEGFLKRAAAKRFAYACRLPEDKRQVLYANVSQPPTVAA